jgi:hypothetical protein
MCLRQRLDLTKISRKNPVGISKLRNTAGLLNGAATKSRVKENWFAG